MHCSYLKHAFPHDELKPLSAGYTDSLAELGNSHRKDGSTYKGSNHSSSLRVNKGAV